MSEFFDLIEPLAHPERFGGNIDDSFTVIASSLPSFEFSGITEYSVQCMDMYLMSYSPCIGRQLWLNDSVQPHYSHIDPRVIADRIDCYHPDGDVHCGFTENACKFVQHHVLSLASQHDRDYVAQLLSKHDIFVYTCQEARGKKDKKMFGKMFG